MVDEDNAVCRAIGEHGFELLLKQKRKSDVLNIITHCNAGGLATVAFGTASAPIYVGKRKGRADSTCSSTKPGRYCRAPGSRPWN